MLQAVVAKCLTCQASGANDVADALTFTVRDENEPERRATLSGSERGASAPQISHSV